MYTFRYFVTMADPNAELHAVFMMIGILDAGMHTTIIDREGFTHLEDLATLVEDKEVDEMAKRMAGHTQAEGRVHLGTVIIQKFKTLIWWVDNQMKLGITPVVADFTVEAMNQASSNKRLRKDFVAQEPLRILESLIWMILIHMKMLF